MKRLIVLLLALGIVASADRRTWADKDAKKEDKKDVKKDDKKDKKDDKKEVEKPKVEAKPTPAQEAELKKLSGTFTVTASVSDGKQAPADELKTMKVVQKMAEWTFYLGEDATKGKDVVTPDKTPKWIDSTYVDGKQKGKTVKGIYKTEGDTITYCWAEPGKERPADFVSKAGDGSTLMTLKRVEEGKTPDKPKEKEKEKEKPKDKPKEKEQPKEKAKEKEKDKEKDKK